MKWLFVTNEFPWPLTHGTWLRVYHLAKALRQQGEEVSILTYPGPAEGIEKYAEAGIAFLPGLDGSPPQEGLPRCRLGPYAYDPSLADRIARAAPGWETVVLVRPRCLQYAPEAAGARCVVAEMVDDPVLEEGRKLWRGWNPLHWARRVKFLIGECRYERVFIEHVQLTTFVSEQDARSFGRRHEDPRVAVVPNGVDASYFDEPSSDGAAAPGPPTITFLANMAHPPNEDAALFLIRKVAPCVWKDNPQVQFVIGGCNPPPPVQRLAGPNVQVTGWVEDVRPLLWKTTAVMLPMRIGTGIKNKLLEAWAAGAPVVATPLACQGVPARAGKNLLIGRSPKDLARSALRLIQEAPLRRKLAFRGKMTVEEYLTWSIAAEKLRQEVAAAPRLGGLRVRRWRGTPARDMVAEGGS